MAVLTHFYAEAESVGSTIAVFALLTICLLVFLGHGKPDIDAPSMAPVHGVLGKRIWGAKFMFRGFQVMAEGYRKYNMFIVPTWEGYDVVVGSQELIKELRDAPHDVLSLSESAKNSTQGEWLMPGVYSSVPGQQSSIGQKGTNLVRGVWKSKIETIVPKLREEFELGFERFIGVDGKEWKEVCGYKTLYYLIGTATSRQLVGLPTSRNIEFLDAIYKNNEKIAIGSEFLKKFVYFDFLKPFAAKYLPNVEKPRRITRGFYKKLVHERWGMMEKYGIDGWKDKPDDYLQWLIDADFEKRRWTDEDFASQMTLLGFASLHTTTITTTAALFELAARPEYHEPLREEITQIMKESNGIIDKTAIDKMHKLDSFIKETQRRWPFVGRGLQRIAVKDFTFSNGTHIPAGTHITTCALATQNDETFYPDPLTFDGFRFDKLRRLRDEEGIPLRDGVSVELTSTSSSMFNFGDGKHACPGRFFAIVEVKLVLSMLLMQYDICFGPKGHPEKIFYEASCLPNMKAGVRFRRRACET